MDTTPSNRRIFMNTLVYDAMKTLTSKDVVVYSDEWNREVNEYAAGILSAYDIVMLGCRGNVPFATIDKNSGEITYPDNEAMDDDLVGFLPTNALNFLTFEIILASLFSGYIEKSDLCDFFGSFLRGIPLYQNSHSIYAALRQREFILRKKIKK
jgi:hypothetical protein